MRTKQTQIFEDEEVKILSEQLMPEELYILGFLKGFDRNVTERWMRKKLFDASINY